MVSAFKSIVRKIGSLQFGKKLLYIVDKDAKHALKRYDQSGIKQIFENMRYIESLFV